MNSFPATMITAHDATSRHVNSARPDAPVVPYTPRGARPWAARSRIALARVLQRAAVAIAPGEYSAAS